MLPHGVGHFLLFCPQSAQNPETILPGLYPKRYQESSNGNQPRRHFHVGAQFKLNKVTSKFKMKLGKHVYNQIENV